MKRSIGWNCSWIAAVYRSELTRLLDENRQLIAIFTTIDKKANRSKE